VTPVVPRARGAGSRAGAGASAGPGPWELRVTAPARMYSVNSAEHWAPLSTARRLWREKTFTLARQNRLPKGLGRARIDIVLHFTSNARRDSANYHPTVGKPIVDALGRGRVVRENGKPPRVEVGYELIPDDTPAYLDGPHLTIGGTVPKQLYPLGLAVVTITDLTSEAL
jgi:hypothetical protein